MKTSIIKSSDEIAGVDDTDQKRYEWKQSVEYVQAIEGFLIELEDRLVDFEDVEFKGIRKSASEIMEIFFMKNIPVHHF